MLRPLDIVVMLKLSLEHSERPLTCAWRMNSTSIHRRYTLP